MVLAGHAEVSMHLQMVWSQWVTVLQLVLQLVVVSLSTCFIYLLETTLHRGVLMLGIVWTKQKPTATCSNMGHERLARIVSIFRFRYPAMHW